MKKVNPAVDLYLIEGCGRCSLYQTPKCKVHPWHEHLVELRRVVLESGLREEYKWSQPCYTYQNKNVLMVTAFKDYACISFFKGSLLKDAEGILVSPGKNSQAAKQLRFTNTDEIIRLEPIIKELVKQAIEIEKKGLKVNFKKEPEPIPEELIAAFKEVPELENAFRALTPGRQRGYILHFSQPKQSQTRQSRILKCIPKIKAGKGFHDK